MNKTKIVDDKNHDNNEKQNNGIGNLDNDMSKRIAITMRKRMRMTR